MQFNSLHYHKHRTPSAASKASGDFSVVDGQHACRLSAFSEVLKHFVSQVLLIGRSYCSTGV